jgi:ElaB/YqjD/DUF883 family membrane-anchored ribosome-binding protein
MAKGRDKAAREKLAKARKQLAELEGVLAEVQADVDERLNAAREKADKQIAKARKRVEKSAATVAELETRVLGKTKPPTPAGEVASPDATVEVLAQTETAVDGSTAPVPGSTAEVPLVGQSGSQPASVKSEISTSTDVAAEEATRPYQAPDGGSPESY